MTGLRLPRMLVAAWLLTLSFGASAAIACMNRGGDALPADAFPVPVARAREIQQLLDAHGRIKLDPAGDYRRATGIMLRSDQAIFGAAGTLLGRLVVEPGTANAIVSGVVPEALEFPASPKRTHDNCFERFASRGHPQQPLRLVNVVVENNLFLDAASIVIDTSHGGRVANNRFIRTLVEGVWPALQVEGHDSASADRNVFLWMNILGAQGDGIVLRHEAELNLLAFDAENWNAGRQGRMSAMLSASDVGTLRTFLPHGGDSKARPGAFMDINARRFELTGTRLIRAADPAIRLHSVAQFTDLFSFGTSYRDEDAGGRLIAMREGTNVVQTQSNDGLASGTVAAMPWQPPVFDAVASPTGPDWRAARKTAKDMRAALQDRINREGIVLLPAGVYFISAPLRLHAGQGIIGAGAGRTAIVGLSDDVDVIVSDDHLEAPRATRFTLMDITLQGGRAGIRHAAEGAGKGAQFNLIHLSHVVFSDMAEAGIAVDGIYGWDNNLLDHLTFRHMPVGIRQIPNPRYAGPAVDGDVAGMNYMDKNVFFRCRFEDVGVGMQMLAKRADGLNACIECRFANFAISAVELENNLSSLFANSDFVGSGSGPVIRSNQLLGIAASRFSAVRDKAVLLDADVACEDCRVVPARGAVPQLVAPNRIVSLVNSQIGNAEFPADSTVLLMDTDASGVAAAGRLRFFSGGQWKTLAGGAPKPRPALLVEWQQ